MKIPDVIKLIAVSTDKTEIREHENNIVRMFISPLLLIGAIVSFVVRYFLISEQITNILIDCVLLIIFMVLLEVLTAIKINAKIKELLITLLLCSIILFLWVRLYYLVGVAVWIFAIIILFVTIIRIEKKMTIIIASLILMLFIISVIIESSSNDFDNLHYIGQTVMFIILIINCLVIENLISLRFEMQQKQFFKVFKAEEKLKATMESVGDGVITTNQEGIIEYINPKAQQITKWKDDEATGEHFDTVFEIYNEYTNEKVISPVAVVLETRNVFELANHTVLITKDGFKKAIEDTAAPIIYKKKDVIGTVVVFRDFSEKREKQNLIEFLSYHDQLTGLYNRRFFEEELKRLDVKRNLPISFIYADVNGLKIINDAFGHEKGDLVIRTVSDILKKECRADDIVSRVGGDEYIILLPKTDIEECKHLALRLNNKINQMKIMEIDLSVSFGWDTKIDDNQTIIETLKKAEDAMYQKKILHSSSKRNGTIKAIMNTLHLKCPREEEHSIRVSEICTKIGKACKFSRDDIDELKTAGELHDIGKIAVDINILNKEGKLTNSEWVQMKHHSDIGFRLLGATSEFNKLADCVLSHHEKWDGTGYPNGIKGNAINRFARIISIADAFDAMISERTYRKPVTVKKAIEEIRKNAGIQFDPDLARVFVEKVMHEKW